VTSGHPKNVGVVRKDRYRHCEAAGVLLGIADRTRVDAYQAEDLRQVRSPGIEELSMVDAGEVANLTTARSEIGEGGSGRGGAETDDDERGGGDDVADVGSNCGNGTED